MMNESKPTCRCGEGPRLIFACSGASDVGEISDGTARQLARAGKGLMCCTAAIGAGIEKIVRKASEASKTIAIDGCEEDCTRIVLERAGFSGFSHLRLTDIGMEKGKSPRTDERVSAAVERASAIF